MMLEAPEKNYQHKYPRPGYLSYFIFKHFPFLIKIKLPTEIMLGCTKFICLKHQK